MRKFAGSSLITHTNAAEFISEIKKCVQSMERKSVEYEVQYKPLIGKNGEVVYTALIMYEEIEVALNGGGVECQP